MERLGGFAKYAFNKPCCLLCFSQLSNSLAEGITLRIQASNLTQQTSDMDEMVKSWPIARGSV